MTRSILITGAYGGMGRAAARLLAKNGFRVFALDRQVDEAEKNILPIEADVTSEESIQTAFRTVSTQTDSLFALIHFAGIYQLDSLVETDSAAFEQIFRINVGGAFLVNKTFLPLLQKGSRILMITSELAPLDPLPFTGLYAITKSTLDKYAYSLRMELQLKDIFVSVLRAGAVKTGMLDVSTDALDRFCRKTALYTCNADRFKKIVESVEAKSITPDRLAQRVTGILQKKKPAFAYAINRNPLLRMLNALPHSLQLLVIKQILKEKRPKTGREKE